MRGPTRSANPSKTTVVRRVGVILTLLILAATNSHRPAHAQSASADGSFGTTTPAIRPATTAPGKPTRRPRLLSRIFSANSAADPNSTAADQTAPDWEPRLPANVTSPGAVPVLAPKGDPAVLPAQGGAQNPTSYINLKDVPVGAESNDPFCRRLLDAYFGEPDPPAPEDPSAPPTRRGYPAPFQSPPAPFSDFIGPTIGVNDTSVYPLMDALYKGRNGQAWKDSRLKIYGWFDPSANASTSRNSNIPLSYNIVPNKLEMSQLILIFERPLDTAQQDHYDWGFKFTNLYGIDYRYTTAKGYFSDQLLKHNHLYGWDPMQMYVDFYIPQIAQGSYLRFGRYISPLDIEAQLSPENYLYTHSLMYTYDPYTFTGLQSITKWNDQLSTMLGIHAGNDMAPWTTSSQVNGELLVKWVSKNNKDSLFGGIDSLGHGYYKNGHDDLQVFGFTWSHKFNDRFTTMTEQYYIWQRDALQGGTVTNGNPHPYFPAVGPGKKLPGLSDSYGIVNYTSYRLNDKNMIVLRSDCLADFQGERTGIPGSYFENTLGLIHHLTPWAIVRPEVRFDYTSGQRGYDNGTKRDMFTFSCDLIIRF
jgi:Putative beta-barrel porin-2, OmpL-like. bbp2